MRILLLTSKVPYPPRDGGVIATLSLAIALQKLGNDITILSMNTAKHYCEISQIPREFSDNINFKTFPLNTNIKLISLIKNFLFSKQPYVAERFISKDFSDYLAKLLQAESFDIVQLEGLYLCPYIETIRKFSSAKIAFRSHNVEFEIWERKTKNEKNPIIKIYFKNLTKRLKQFETSFINRYDFLIPITERDGNRFNQLGNKKAICVVQTGINTERYIISESESEFPGFFSIGTLDWLPNQEGLFWFIDNVWVKFAKKYPDAKFYIAGRNAPKKLTGYFKNKNIVYLGEIEDANSFINSKSIMVVPLLSGSGMRIKIVEGMALGKTIITTTIGTEGIHTTHNENILIADSPNDFYNCLELIYNNKEIHKKISNNAKNFIYNNMNNYNIAEKLLKFYLEN